MTDRFNLFVVLADMRTGSNFLEANLNALDGIACHGEAFNPHFVGYPNRDDVLGIGQGARDEDPSRLLDAIRYQTGVLGGFRFFSDHDPRVLDIILDDPRCAKIILTRNPLDSYVSLKIARETGQWKLTNIKRRKDARPDFDADEFAAHLAAHQAFQLKLLHRLQCSGQTPFYIGYDDLRDLDVINGLAAWLGVPSRLDRLDDGLKPQNPAAITEKIGNPEALAEGLSQVDRFDLTRTPNFEPRRGAAVPGYVVSSAIPLMYLPLRGGPVGPVTDWIASLDGAGGDPETGMNRKRLKQWQREHSDHRSFTVLRHPLARAHSVFCARILNDGPGSYRQIRNTLRRQFRLPIPGKMPAPGYGRDEHRAAFEAFLRFVKANLAGQTPIRMDAEWGTQAVAIEGFAQVVPPDLVLRETDLADDLPALATRLDHPAPPPFRVAATDEPHELADIYDADLERLAADIYQRDYLTFGFGPWRTG